MTAMNAGIVPSLRRIRSTFLAFGILLVLILIFSNEKFYVNHSGRAVRDIPRLLQEKMWWQLGVRWVR